MALGKRGPVAILVQKGTFAKYNKRRRFKPKLEMTREEAIKTLVEHIDKDSCIVSTTGMTSRELFEIRQQREETPDRDFLTVGSMGHALAIAHGIAITQKNRSVYCLDGDGAMLMHMGTVAIVGQSKVSSLRHILLNNGAHDSVGGQPTVGFNLDIPRLALSCGYEWAETVDNKTDFQTALAKTSTLECPSLINVKVRRGARPDLGRPTVSPRTNINMVQAFLTSKLK